MNRLIHNKELLSIILNSIDEGILIVDEKSRVYFVNDKFLSIFNIEDCDKESLSFPDIINKERARDLFVLNGIERQKEIELRGRRFRFKYISHKEDDERFHLFILKEMNNREKQLLEEKFNIDMVEDLLEYAYEGFALVDAEGRIVKWNYEELLGIKEEEVIGKPVQDVIENTRLHIIVKTGKKEIKHIQRIQGHDMVANRIPIIRDGKIIGAVGAVLFKDANDVREMAKELIELENKIKEYKGEIERLQDTRYTFDSILTQNPKMEYLKKLARTAAMSNSTVLILGESGTGKELFAQAIHKASYRKFGPFIPINCAAIPRELLESELFGYEGGAFTGAKKQGKPGKFELANGGTIFLDEIGTMPLEMQAKLLRVLETKEFERIGSNKKITLDARIIAATNENLEEAIEKGYFREDLYYRLNVISIDIPPLRERKEDIPLLAQHLLDDLCKELDTEKKKLNKRTIEILKQYKWPGNIRELRNTLERAITISSGSDILPEHLPERILNNGMTSGSYKKSIQPLKEVLERTEKEAIINAIKSAKGNKTLAASRLGIHRTALYKKMKKYGIKN